MSSSRGQNIGAKLRFIATLVLLTGHGFSLFAAGNECESSGHFVIADLASEFAQKNSKYARGPIRPGLLELDLKNLGLDEKAIENSKLRIRRSAKGPVPTEISTPVTSLYRRVRLTESQASLLRARGHFVEPDCKVSIPKGFSKPTSQVSEIPSKEPPSQVVSRIDSLKDYLWGLEAARFYQAWQITSGSPDIRVGVCDTGVDWEHEDLIGQAALVGGEPAVFDSTNTEFSPLDRFSHGTHVIGTIAAIKENGIGIMGAAPHVRYVSGKALSSEGYGYSSWITSCIQAMIDTYSVDVINLSIGGSVGAIAEYELQRASDRGIIVVIAAGNDSTNNVRDGDLNSVKSTVKVAALADIKPYNQPDLASFSNFGNWVDIAAPGQGIWSTIPRGMLSSEPLLGAYFPFSGTSMAAPHISALAALTKSVYRGIDTQTFKQILREGSIEFSPSNIVAANAFNPIAVVKRSPFKHFSVNAEAVLQATLRVRDDAIRRAKSVGILSAQGQLSRTKMSADDRELIAEGWVELGDSLDIELGLQVLESGHPGTPNWVELVSAQFRGCDRSSALTARSREDDERSQFCRQRFALRSSMGVRQGSYQVRVVARRTGFDSAELSALPEARVVFVPLLSRNRLPVGIVESLEINGRNLTVKGWAWDPDVSELPGGINLPLITYVFSSVNTQGKLSEGLTAGFGVSILTNLTRPDVKQKYGHLFDLSNLQPEQPIGFEETYRLPDGFCFVRGGGPLADRLLSVMVFDADSLGRGLGPVPLPWRNLNGPTVLGPARCVDHWQPQD